METVTEDTILEIGKFYNVRCAEYIYNDKIPMYVPIIGEPHKDKKFNIPYLHYHIDGRFMTKNRDIVVNNLGQTNSILPLKESGFHGRVCVDIVIKRRKCVRLTTGINPPLGKNNYTDWYKTMVGKSCKGKKCPHLGTKMLEQEGKLVCPLHGLVGNKKSNVIIHHFPLKNKKDNFVEYLKQKVL